MIQYVILEMLHSVCLSVCTPSIHGFLVPSMATTDHRFQAHVHECYSSIILAIAQYQLLPLQALKFTVSHP